MLREGAVGVLGASTTSAESHEVVIAAGVVEPITA